MRKFKNFIETRLVGISLSDYFLFQVVVLIILTVIDLLLYFTNGYSYLDEMSSLIIDSLLNARVHPLIGFIFNIDNHPFIRMLAVKSLTALFTTLGKIFIIYHLGLNNYNKRFSIIKIICQTFTFKTNKMRSLVIVTFVIDFILNFIIKLLIRFIF